MRDPFHVGEHRDAAFRALRCAIAIPISFFIGQQLIGGTQLPLYSAFGGFALLVFADFPGDRTARAMSYGMLGIAGAVLISLGTVLAPSRWLAVVVTLVVATGILFSGVLSASLAGASRAALLMLVLPVTTPGDVSVLPGRLAGWALAFAVCVPAALLLFPPRQEDELRDRIARACDALANELDACLADDQCVPADDAHAGTALDMLTELRAQLRDAKNRPVGLTAGSRALMRVVGELEWLTPFYVDAPQLDGQSWRPEMRDTGRACVAVLRASAAVLDRGTAEAPAARRALTLRLDELSTVRAAAFDSLVRTVVRGPGDDGDEWGRLVLRPHEVASTTERAGRVVSWSVAADARPVIQRIFGRGLDGLGDDPRAPSPAPALRTVTATYVRDRSVWFRNSVRGGIGLALAVLVADYFDLQHGFWVVLGAMAVLRSSALTTGSTGVRAVIGTVAGFAIGAVIILVVGTEHIVLWIVFPLAVLIASYAPAAISFAAGQAAFTVVIVILYNLVAPVGWRVGVVRIEDVLIGCAVSLLVGVLLWPRGATAAIGAALTTAYRTGADFFGHAADVVTHAGSTSTRELDQVRSVGQVLDDAVRQYQVEVGGNRDQLAQVVNAAEGAARLRLAGEAVLSLGPVPAGIGDRLPSSRAVLARHVARVVADARERRGSTPASGGDAGPVDVGGDVVTVMRDELRHSPPVGDLPERLLWTSMYVQDIERSSTM